MHISSHWAINVNQIKLFMSDCLHLLEKITNHPFYYFALLNKNNIHMRESMKMINFLADFLFKNK